MSQCADNNNDHKCDVCGTELSECADGNNDHKCDVCGTKLSDCADEDKDHKCDICGTELSQCADNNNDHKCDVCGTKLSECSGGTATCTKKAVCSVCGREYGDLAAHTPAAAVEENRVTSTCTVAGSYDSVVYCSVCKTHEISRETMTLELSDHTYDQKVVTEDYLNTAATCQEKATYFKSCTCGATGEETFEYGDPAGHTYGEPAYSWNDTTLTVTLTCGKCEEGTDNKILTGSAEGTVKSSTVGDCKTNATTTYEATVTLNGKAYPNETTITGELGGHSYSGGSCTICGEADPDAPAEKDINIQIADVPNASKNGVSVIGDVENGLLVIDTIYSDGNSIETVYVHLIKCTLNDGSVVTLKNDDGKYRDGDFTLPDGAVSVTVESRMLGDLNGSGSITLADLVLLRRTVAGNYTLNELQEIVANTNNSFKDNAITITLADMVLLRRHIAGNYDF